MARTNLGTLEMDVKMRVAEARRSMAAMSKGLQNMGVATKQANAMALAYGRSLGKAGQAVAGFGKQTEKTRGIVRKTLEQMRRFLVLVGTFIVFRRIGRVLTEFETRMAEISTIAGESETKVKGMRDAILDLAKVLPQSPADLAAGAYQVLSAGITDATDALIVLRASATAAVAGLTDTRSAVDAITTVLNAYQFTADQATRVSDVLFKTVELGKVTFGELSQNIGNVATSAALAGVSLEETAAAIATLTKFGIGAAEATTSLNRLFLTLTSQSKEQGKAFERLGVDFNVATVRARGFAGLLQELNRLTDEQIEELAKLFPNIRAARAAFVLAGKGVNEYISVLAQTEAAQGAAERAAAKMNETLANQFKLLLNNLNVAFQRLGEVLLPAITRQLERFNRRFVSHMEIQIDLLDRYGFAWQAVATRQQEAFRTTSETLAGLEDQLTTVQQRLTEASLTPVQVGGGLPFEPAAGAALPEQARAYERIREILNETADIEERRKQLTIAIGEAAQRQETLASKVYETAIRALEEEADLQREIHRVSVELLFLMDREYLARQQNVAVLQQAVRLAGEAGLTQIEEQEKLRLQFELTAVSIENLAKDLQKLGPEVENFVVRFDEGDPVGMLERIQENLGRIAALLDFNAEAQETWLELQKQGDPRATGELNALRERATQLKDALGILRNMLVLAQTYVAALEKGNGAFEEGVGLLEDQIALLRDLNLEILSRQLTGVFGKAALEFDKLARKVAETLKVELGDAVEQGLELIGPENFERIFGNVDESLQPIVDALRRLMGMITFDEPMENIERDLQARFDSLTRGAAEMAYRAFEEWIAEFGQLPDELEPMAAAIREKLLSAFELEKAEEELAGIRERLEAELLAIDAEGLGIEQTAQRQAMAYDEAIARAEDLRGLLNEILTTEEGRVEANKLITKFINEQKAAASGADKKHKQAGRELEDQLRDWLAIVALINQGVDGLIDFLKQTGAISDSFADILDGVRQLAIGIETLKKSLSVLDQFNEFSESAQKLAKGAQAMALGGIVSGGLGILGGLSNIFGGLFGGGPSPEELERRRIQEENTKALMALRDTIHELAGTFDIAGQEFVRAFQALGAILESESPRVQAFIGEPLVLDYILRGLGSSLRELEQVAEAAGITIYDSAGRIIPEALEELLRAMRTMEPFLAQFPKTIESVFQQLQIEFDLFDVDDPIEQLRRLQEALYEFSGQALVDQLQAQIADVRAQMEGVTDPTILGMLTAQLQQLEQALREAEYEARLTELPAFADLFQLDVSDPEQRRIMEETLQQLFRDLQAGIITPEMLGAATLEEAVQILRQMEGLLDEIGETSGETQNVMRSVSITELQANQLLAYQATMATIQGRIERLLVDMLAIMQTGAIAAPQIVQPLGTGGGTTLNIDVDLNIDTITLTGEPAEQANEFATQTVETIKRQLGEEFRRTERLLGIN